LKFPLEILGTVDSDGEVSPDHMNERRLCPVCLWRWS